MNIEVHQPRLEALIEQRMASGRFENIEDALLQALEAAPLPETPEPTHRTGADLIAAMQAMPYRDEIEFEHSRLSLDEAVAQLKNFGRTHGLSLGDVTLRQMRQEARP